MEDRENERRVSAARPAGVPKPSLKPPLPSDRSSQPDSRVQRRPVTPEASPKAALSARAPKSLDSAGDTEGSHDSLRANLVTGMSIPLKFTLVSSATVALISFFFGMVVYLKSSSALEHEIDQFGATVAKVVSSVYPSCWNPEHGTFRDVQSWLKGHYNEKTAFALNQQFGVQYDRRVEESFEARPRNTRIGDGGAPMTDLERERLHRSNAALIAGDAARARSNEGRLVRAIRFDGPSGNVGYADVVDIIVRNDATGEGIMANEKSGAASFTEADARDFVLEGALGASATSVSVVRGHLGTGSVARAYRIRVPNEKGEPSHSVRVFVSEEKIQNKLSSLLRNILVVGLLVTAVGATVSFLVTKLMMRPVTTLVEDIEIVSAGNLDHRVRSYVNDEFGLIARTFDRMVRHLKEASEMEAKTKVLEHELSVASEVQSKLLPEKPPAVPSFEIDAAYKPSREVGGNYYDFLPFGAQGYGFVVASVPATGLPASLTMAMARSLIRAESERSDGPAAALKAVNRHLARDIRKGLYVAAVLAMLEPGDAAAGRKSRIRFCSVGQLPLYLLRAGGGSKVQALKTAGIALGLDPGPIFEKTLEEGSVELSPGDRIVLFSEGALRVKNDAGEPFGEARFRDLVEKLASRNSNAFVNLAVGHIDKWRGAAPQTDDITILTLKQA